MFSVVKQLQSQGFEIIGQTHGGIRMVRGSDHRVVLPNGTMKRGKPGKKNYH